MSGSWIAAAMIMTLGTIALAAPVTVVKDGQPIAKLVLPVTTEFPAYEEAAKQKIEAHFAQVVQRRGADWIKQPKQQALATLAKELKTVGDEEELAAAELASIVKAISGAPLEVVRADTPGDVAGPKVLLGAALARKAGLGERLDTLAPDGFIVVSQGDTLILSGRRARGTLYAVYHLLEHWGCRWIMPGPFGELYPATTTLSADLDVTENPDHSVRYWWCTYGNGKEYPQWTLRMKGNFVRALGDPAIAQGHSWPTVLAWGAKSSRFAVKAEDGKSDLPEEFYAQKNGKPYHHAPNFASPAAQQLFAEYFIDSFDRNPQAQYASLSATDGIMVDEHPQSMKLRTHEFDFATGAVSSTDVIWHFARNVIDRVAEVYPDRKFGILVYSNNMTPPRLEMVHPKMALVLAPLSISPTSDIRDERSRTNRWWRQWLEAWMAQKRHVGAEAYLYDYEPMGYSWNQTMICPRWMIIAKNYPYLKQLGLDGHTTQGFDTWLASGLNHWMMMRLYWDADADVESIINDYCQARFGAAADAMRSYYRVYEQRMAEISDLVSNENWGNHLMLTPACRMAARHELDKAVAAADTPRAKTHVANMVLVQKSTDIMCDAIEHARQTGDFAAAAKMMEGSFAICNELNQLYSHFIAPAWIDTSKKRQPYLAAGLYQLFGRVGERVAAAPQKVLLPRTWKGGLDSDNLAVTRGWHLPNVQLAGADDMDITLIPDVTYHTQREPAAFFYRTDIDVPASFADAPRHVLYFPAIIARAVQIWVNGKRLTFNQDGLTDTTWRGPDYFWVNYDHQQAFDLTGYLDPGKKNSIAVRVFKSFDHGGSYQRPWLLGEAAAAEAQ